MVLFSLIHARKSMGFGTKKPRFKSSVLITSYTLNIEQLLFTDLPSRNINIKSSYENIISIIATVEYVKGPCPLSVSGSTLFSFIFLRTCD